jgi:hypothetical protein
LLSVNIFGATGGFSVVAFVWRCDGCGNRAIPGDGLLERARRVESEGLRAAIEAAPYFHPKLAVNANVNAGDDFAARLERAIARSGKIVSRDASRPKALLALPPPRLKVE